MILYRDALEQIETLGRALAKKQLLGTESVPLENGVGRILAQSLQSRENVPAFANSAMDGYAVRARETRGASKQAPLTFKVAGTLSAGDHPVSEKQPGTLAAWEIMTGAPVPAGFDAVIKVEDTQKTGENVQLLKAVLPGENVRDAGEDFRLGDEVARPGTVLKAQHVLVLAGLGMEHVLVYRKPRIAVISTGKELVDHARQTLEPGQIRNSTGPYLKAALAQFGCEAFLTRVKTDSPEEFRETLLKHMECGSIDAIVTTGAVSMGKHDYIAPVLQDLGAQIHFHKVAMRPGKPILFSELPNSRIAFFGLPGNPISTAVGLRFFVLPFLRAFQGLAPETPMRARLLNSFSKPEGLRCFYKACTGATPQGFVTEILPGQASFMVSPLLQSNSWVILPEPGKEVSAEQEVDVVPTGAVLSGEFEPGSTRSCEESGKTETGRCC